MSRARATGAMLGDAEVMPEVGCMPRGQRISPWSDGRPADGADREILVSLMAVFGPTRNGTRLRPVKLGLTLDQGSGRGPVARVK